ncbi:hypothetical protein BDR06DRAFT_966755 [Suillus hirtellus]|nr:hypothetical protein BDR06DRAFT_966755 [Suillus hirtellus]
MNWTHPHHNLDGSLTFVQVEMGKKKWGLWRHVHEDTITRTNLSDITPELTDLYKKCKKILETWHGEVITLVPKDMLEWSLTYRTYCVALPLIALCIMVLDCKKYVPASAEKPNLKILTTKPVQDIANAIIKHFWRDLKTAKNVYHKKKTDGSNSQMHLGQPISRDELLTCLKHFTTL